VDDEITITLTPDEADAIQEALTLADVEGLSRKEQRDAIRTAIAEAIAENDSAPDEDS
jgi:hypothetical protein